MAKGGFRFGESLLLWFALAYGLAHVAEPAVPLSAFFPFGVEHGDLLQSGFHDAGVIPLVTPFKFLGSMYNPIHVNFNGLLSFIDPITKNLPKCSPHDTPFIAPFWAGVFYNFPSEQIFYRKSTDPLLSDCLSKHARQAFGVHFSPKEMVIVTWVDVTYDRDREDCQTVDSSRNTFQAVVASDGCISTSLFLYNKINWTGSNTTNVEADCQTGLGGRPAETAFDPGNNKTFFPASPLSCTPAMVDLDHASADGLLFRIDSVPPRQGVYAPNPAVCALRPRRAHDRGLVGNQYVHHCPVGAHEKYSSASAVRNRWWASTHDQRQQIN